MNEYYDTFRVQAKEKLDKGLKENMDRYGNAMKHAIHDALLDFCKQDGEFAQAVAQGGSFGDCMKAVSKCVKGNAISDMEAYGAAVKFYFPGAGINVKMTIDLCASVNSSSALKTEPNPESPAADSRGVVIDLSEFF